jgi:hypothetical protein
VVANLNGRTGAYPYDNVWPSPDGRTVWGMTGGGGPHDPTCARRFGTVFALAVA